MTIDTSTEAVERAAAWMDLTPGHHSVANLLRALSRERDEWKKRAELARSELLNVDVSHFPPGQHHQRKMIYTAIHRLDPAVKIDDKYFERPHP